MQKRYRIHLRSGFAVRFRRDCRRNVKKCALWLAHGRYTVLSTGFDGNGSTDSLPLYGNEAIGESRRGGLIAFPDCRNVGMPLTPSLSREISSNFQPGIEIYAAERRHINLSADQ